MPCPWPRSLTPDTIQTTILGIIILSIFVYLLKTWNAWHDDYTGVAKVYIKEKIKHIPQPFTVDENSAIPIKEQRRRWARVNGYDEIYQGFSDERLKELEEDVKGNEGFREEGKKGPSKKSVSWGKAAGTKVKKSLQEAIADYSDQRVPNSAPANIAYHQHDDKTPKRPQRPPPDYKENSFWKDPGDSDEAETSNAGPIDDQIAKAEAELESLKEVAKQAKEKAKEFALPKETPSDSNVL